MERKFDLEDRLIGFAAQIIRFSDQMNTGKAGSHLAGQIVRSATSTALNYGEAQSGESKRDFIHKLKVILKELRETRIALKIIEKADLLQDKATLVRLKDESNQLISIFVKSVDTASKNNG